MSARLLVVQSLKKISLAVSCCALSMATTVWAEVYPNRSIRMVVPYTAAGGTDLLGRSLSAKLAEALGQTVIVENRPGADGMIGTELVVRSPADGYTLLFNSNSHSVNPAIRSKINFDTVKDLRCVTQTATQQMILVVHPSLPVQSVKELIDYGKQKKGELNFASSSKATQLPMELFNWMAGLEMTNILYKGSGPAMTDLLGGRIQTSFAGGASVMPLIKAGKLRALAIGDNKRSALTPDIPTVAETVLPDFYATLWSALFVPNDTPVPILNRLNKEVTAILREPVFKEKIEELGFEPVGSSPAECDQFVANEIKKWQRAIKEAGLKPE